MGRVAIHLVTRRPIDVAVSKDLAADKLPLVYGHEIGHVIDQLAGEIGTKGIKKELKSVYDTLNNPNSPDAKP